MLRAMERAKEQSSSLSGFANDILVISDGFKKSCFVPQPTKRSYAGQRNLPMPFA